MAVDAATGALLNEQRAQLAQELSTSAQALNRAAITAERLSRFLTSLDFEEQSSSEQQAAYFSALAATKDLSAQFTLADASGAKKRTRAGKEKDPDAPKRPISSYMFYQEAVRKDMVEKHPGLQYKEVLKMIGQQWKEMSDDEKAPYIAAHDAASAQHGVDVAAYEKTKGESPVAPAKPVVEKKDKPKEKEKTKEKAARTDSKSSKTAAAPPPSKKSSKAAPPPPAPTTSSSEDEEESEEDGSSSEEESESEPAPPKKKSKTAESVKPASKAVSTTKSSKKK